MTRVEIARSPDQPRTVHYGRCPECGCLMFPIPELSVCGHRADPERIALDDTGTVYSFTRSRLGGVDTLLAMVDFFDGRLRVTAPVMGSKPLSTGDHLRLVEGSDGPYSFIRAG